MAVVSGISNLITPAMSYLTDPPDPVAAKGRLITATGTVENAATDSNLSKWELVRLPSICLLHPLTFFNVTNWGFAQIVIGSEDDTDALVDQTKATENVVTPIAQGGAMHGLALWTILGLASDPGGQLSLYAHAEAAATGAGSMQFQVVYIMP
ncbi:hypothetical protein CDO87_03425 [Sagittula sp. P11]|uniref:hypothetical protein n=1 Tax=Sagittula sp. P11 TaxID=2009329 RepID=UPI000C2CF589|nr:hypothetical protein [Sagittula sp. P11]AUC52296.1 hypothetical protein CDO87_03425 [Sagittula sp. P11]